MAIILAENFSSAMSIPQSGYSRWGGNSLTPVNRWIGNLVPYVDVNRGGSYGSYEIQSMVHAVSSSNSDAKRIVFAAGGLTDSYLSLYFKQGTVVTAGICLQFMELGSISSPVCSCLFSFRSMLENSSTEKENFNVLFTIDPIHMNSATISFVTGGSGFPAISPETIYWDFSNMPVWIWVQCDMADAVNKKGRCRVWIGDELVAVRENIYTGDVSSWAAQPWYSKNNRVVVLLKTGSTYSSSLLRDIYVYGVAATNEDQGYMDAALGEIALTTVHPSTLASVTQWEPARDGMAIAEDNALVLRNNTFLELGALSGKKYLRCADHMGRDLHQHDHPFAPGTHVLAVSQAITHKKASVPGDTSKYRIEPVLQASGQAPAMDRNKGQPCVTTPRVLQVFHTIPYAGAFWTEEILSLCKFGFTLFDYARPETVSDGIGMADDVTVEGP